MIFCIKAEIWSLHKFPILPSCVHSAKMLWAVAEGHEVFVGADADAQRVELVQDLGNVAAAVGLVAAQHSLKLRAVGVKVQAHDVDLHAALVGGAIKAAELAAAQPANCQNVSP